MKAPLHWNDLTDDERDAFARALFEAVDLSDPEVFERFLDALRSLLAQGHPGVPGLAQKIDLGEVDLEEV